MSKSMSDKTEGNKLFYDLFKHVTTISTGSIVILVTFLEKLFSRPIWRPLIAIALGGFAVSILSSLIVMFINAMDVFQGDLSNRHKKTMNRFFLLVVFSFLTGIISLVVFAIKNLFP